MAEEIAQLKQLQTNLNAAFDNLFKSSQERPSNPRVVSDAKERIGKLAQVTLAAVFGPVFSILNVSSQVILYHSFMKAI